MSLVSTSDYRTYLGISTTSEDTFIGVLAGEVEANVKQFLNRDLEVTTYTETYDGDGTPYLVLKQFPVNTITSISEYDGLDSNNAEVWTSWTQGVDYERLVIQEEGVVFMDGQDFPEGELNIKVVYNAGHSTIPEDIQRACKELVYIKYHNVRSEKRLGKDSTSMNAGASGTENYDTNVLQKIFDQIKHYRKICV